MDKGSHVSLKFHILHPKLKSVKIICFFLFFKKPVCERPMLLLKHKKTMNIKQSKGDNVPR